MASIVDIVNLALSHLGDEAEVISISPPDGTIQASHGGRFYPIARDQLLEMHPWTFATRRIALAQVTGSEQPEWLFTYALPNKCLRPLSVLLPDAYSDADSEDYKVESAADGTRILYTNIEQATLRYIQLVEDTTKFSPGFVMSLGRLLASLLAGPIIKGETGIKVSASQLQIWLTELGNAKALDANVGHSSAYRTRVPDGVKARGARTSSDWRGC